MSQAYGNTVTRGTQPALNKRRPKIRWQRTFFLAPAVIYVVILFVYPLAYNLMMSFQNYTIQSMVSGVAPFIGFGNYWAVLSNPVMTTTVWNTVMFTLGSIVFQFIFAMLFALYFKDNFPLSQLFRTILLIPWLLPLLVSGSTFKWMFDQTDGVLNQILLSLHLVQHPVGWLVTPHMAMISVIITNVWVGIPFQMIMYHSGLQDIPKEYYEASSIDGANKWKQFWYITLPSLRPVIAIVLMLSLIYTLKVFDVVMVLTGGGPANSTQILSTWSYALSFTDMSFGQGAAVGNIMILISLMASLFYLRLSRHAQE